ncbi:hypothetical protein [Mammaliicoccus lentus]|uniref:hypothetical protein n=1 Tax=Mammaliicoccus lentus TaxID=42858 RepID=UPI00264758F5|nr:hypothetical protein [Mammaliicoccus lentus]
MKTQQYIKTHRNFYHKKAMLLFGMAIGGEGAGYVAIVQSANINTFVSLDQN